MKLDCIPFPSAGKPLVVRLFGWVMIVASLIAESGEAFLAGIALLVASTGRDALLDENLVLRYALLRVQISNPDEVVCLSRLERGRLIKWATPLILEPFFLVLAIITLLTKDVEISLLLPVAVYWVALYSEIIIVPLKALRERLTSSIIIPLAVSLPAVLLNGKIMPMMFFVWGMGTFSILNLLLRDGLVIRVGKKGYLLLCGDTKKLMEVILHAPYDV
ncbi:MAG: hypothetical protein J7L37_05365 [Thermococcus sp.]|nr:hypothetical protein [Thermococcus sp.]